MLKSKLMSSGTWYREGAVTNFKDSHKVTNANHNEALGIEFIRLNTVDAVKPGSPLFRMTLELSNGVQIFGDIFAQKNGNGINLNLPQDSYVDAQGVKQYRDRIILGSAVLAQVLRYTETLLEEVQAPAQAYQAPVQQQAPVYTEQTVQTPVPAPSQTNAFEGITAEALAEFMANRS